MRSRQAFAPIDQMTRFQGLGGRLAGLVRVLAVVIIPLVGCGGDTPTSPSGTPPTTETGTWVGTLVDPVHGTATLRIHASGVQGVLSGTWALSSPTVSNSGVALVNLTMLDTSTPAVLLEPSSTTCPGRVLREVFSLELSGPPAAPQGTSRYITCEGVLVAGQVVLVRQ